MKMTNERKAALKLCELVWFTLQQEEKFMHDWMGNELRYYIAGSFATHVHNGKYKYNDIDVFVIDFKSELIDRVDESQRYEISKSYKVPLKNKNGCIFMSSKFKKKVLVNVVCVTGCSGLQHLLNFFDINCCQIGFELNISNGNLGEVVYTEHYKKFRTSRILEVVTFDTPATSLCRLLKKSHELGLSKQISAVHLLNLKHSHDSCKCVNKGLFREVSGILALSGNQDRRLMEYFDTEIISPSEEEINQDFYDHGEYGELSASMSFLIKNGRCVRVTFSGNFRKQFHMTCIHGEVDEFSTFRRLVELNGAMNVFVEKDVMNLSPVDYLLSHSSPFAIQSNNYVITQLLGC